MSRPVSSCRSSGKTGYGRRARSSLQSGGLLARKVAAFRDLLVEPIKKEAFE